MDSRRGLVLRVLDSWRPVMALLVLQRFPPVNCGDAGTAFKGFATPLKFLAAVFKFRVGVRVARRRCCGHPVLEG